ncbi:MAG: GMC family oxidoreductase [Azospirillaceae bacterium]
MIHSTRDLPAGHVHHGDLCVIGSGAAGIVLAHALANSGLRIVVLESGTVRRPGRAPAGPDPRNHVDVVGHAYDGALAGRARAFGGTTTIWAGQSLPLDPIDFEARPWVPGSGWPIGPETIAPYWERAERYLRLSGMRYADAAWRTLDRAPPPLDGSGLRPVASWMARNRDFARLYRADLNGDDNVEVLLEATAMAIRPPSCGGGRYAVRFLTAAGREATVESDLVVICCGGLETPRLLLASTEGVPAGLGNAHGLVGRYLMDHPAGVCATVADPDLARLTDWFRPFYRREGRVVPKIALGETVQRRHRTLNALAELAFVPRAGSGFAAAVDCRAEWRAGRPMRAARHALALAGSGREASSLLWQRLVARRRPVGAVADIGLVATVEQAPDPDSRVTLSDSLDEAGMRRARVDWRLSEAERHTLRVFVATLSDAFARIGLGRVVEAAELADGQAWALGLTDSYHPMGTTRMASDPRRGVVNANLQVHGHPGLFVASSAVFPTGGASNPTLTLIALTLRLADHLRARGRPPT